MNKVYHCCLIFFITILPVSCEYLAPTNAFRAAPDSNLTSNFVSECLDSFEFSNNLNHDGDKCGEIRQCLTKSMNTSVLSSYSAWPLVEKIMPSSGKYPTPIADMRTNAEKAGPKAVEMFQLIYDIRKQCVIKTRLDNIIADT